MVSDVNTKTGCFYVITKLLTKIGEYSNGLSYNTGPYYANDNYNIVQKRISCVELNGYSVKPTKVTGPLCDEK